MNIFNKVTFQSMKKNSTRTLVTIIGVALSAAMITGVVTFGVSLLNYLTNGAVMKYGDWHVEFMYVDSSFVDERTSDNEVSYTAVVENIGYAELEGSRNPDKPYVFINGFNDKAFDTLPITLISGRMPENSREIIVPSHVAANGGVKYSVGDTVSFDVGKRMNEDKELGQHDPYVSGNEDASNDDDTSRSESVSGDKYTSENKSISGNKDIAKNGSISENKDIAKNESTSENSDISENEDVSKSGDICGNENASINVDGKAKETLVPEEKKDYTVVGIYQRPRFEEISAPGYTLITRAENRDKTGENVDRSDDNPNKDDKTNAGQYVDQVLDKENVDDGDKAGSFSIFVKLKDPYQVHDYADKVSGGHDFIFNDSVLRFMGISDDNLFNGLIYSVGIIVVVIIMTGSIFLIYNSFNISLNERTHQFGILSSVGATARQLQNSVLFEGVCIGAVGIPIGVLVGIGCIKLVISVVNEKFQNVMYSGVPLKLTLSIPAIIGAVVVSMVTIMISAYIPARKAATTPVMECIRQTNEVKVEAKEIKISKLAQHIYGLEGILALKNFKRNKKRYRSIVLSLVLSIVLFISVNAFVMDLKQASERAEVVTNYDIAFSAKEMDDDEMLSLYDKLKTADGVYESSYQELVTYSCSVKHEELSEYFWKVEGSSDYKLKGEGHSEDYSKGDGSSDNYLNGEDSHSADETVNLKVDLQFLDDSTYFNIIKDLGLNEDEYTGENAKMIGVAKMQGSSDLKEEHDQFNDMFKSLSMNFFIAPKTPDDIKMEEGQNLDESGVSKNKANEEVKVEQGKNVRVTFVDTVPPDTPPILEKSEQKPYFFRIMAPYSIKDKFETPDVYVDAKGLTFSSNNSTRSASEMESMLQGEGITEKYNLYNMGKMLDDSRNYIFIANVFAYTFIIMISLIAVANVFNTISTNIKLRRRELAMLRSVGMSERDFQKMMNFECAFYGMRALLFGLPISIISSWLIYKGMVAGGVDNMKFVLPWASIGISVFCVLFIVFITMLYSISKIKKENIIDALRDDMD